MKKILFLSAALMMGAVATPALADAAAGETVFRKCKACHQIGANAKNGAGPHLEGIVGRKAGSIDGFGFGKDLVAAGEKGLIWDEAQIAEYVLDPAAFLKKYLGDDKAKSKMSFKLKDEQQRQDVAAYLANPDGADSAAAAPAPSEPAKSDDEVIAEQTFSEGLLTDAAVIKAGGEIWHAQCTHCHGFKAYPGKAPKLKPAKYTPEFVFKRVYKGFKKMPAWKDTFSVDEIRSIVAYVKSHEFSP